MLRTNIGQIISRVSSASGFIEKGTPEAGSRIQGGLKAWFIKNRKARIGHKVRFKCIRPYEEYELRVV